MPADKDDLRRKLMPERGDVPPLKSGDHASGCAMHNAPAYEAGPCDCGADWTPATTHPSEDVYDVMVRMSDGSERIGNACFDPRTGEFDGWMYKGDINTLKTDVDLEVVAWRRACFEEPPLPGCPS